MQMVATANDVALSAGLHPKIVPPMLLVPIPQKNMAGALSRIPSTVILVTVQIFKRSYEGRGDWHSQQRVP